MHAIASGLCPAMMLLAAVSAAACTGGGAPSGAASPPDARESVAIIVAGSTLPATPSPVVTPTPTSTPSTPPASAPPVPTSTPDPSPTPRAEPTCLADPILDAFATTLLADLASGDEVRIAARMADSFQFVAEATDVKPLEMAPRDGSKALVRGLDDPFAGYRPLERGSAIYCVLEPPRDVLASNAWMLEGRYDAAILTRGWGPGGDEEAVLYIVRERAGAPAWRAVLYSLAGFAH